MVAVHRSVAAFVAETAVTIVLVPLHAAHEPCGDIGRHVAVAKRVHWVEWRYQPGGAIGIVTIGAEVGHVRIRGEVRRVNESISRPAVRVEKVDRTV